MAAFGPAKINLILYAASMVVHGFLASHRCRRLNLSRWIALGLSPCYLLGMGLGARLFYDLVNHRLQLSSYTHPAYYISDGLWGGPLAYLILATIWVLCVVRQRDELSQSCGRRFAAPLPLSENQGSALDVMVLSMPIPMAIVKVGCLFNGCCFGTPCDWPWCVVYPYGAAPPAGIARHPTQVYEIAALLFVYFVLVTLERRRWDGLLTLWFAFLYGIARPVTEFFRMPTERRALIGILSASQAICLAGACSALAALWILRPPRRVFERPTIQLAFG